MGKYLTFNIRNLSRTMHFDCRTLVCVAIIVNYPLSIIN